MSPFIHVRSAKFSILPGEADEIVNEGMYGKALAAYLQEKLRERGYEVPFYCCEDWGWWVEIKGAPFAFGVCIYAGPETGGPMDYVCTDGAVADRKWSWKQFRFIETASWTTRLHQDLLAIFRTDPDVEIVGVVDEMPF